jgi:uncharacterized membrane protein
MDYNLTLSIAGITLTIVGIFVSIFISTQKRNIKNKNVVTLKHSNHNKFENNNFGNQERN